MSLMDEADNELARSARLPGSPAAQRVVGPFAALLDRARDAYRA